MTSLNTPWVLAVSLWSTGLLLSSFTFCTSLALEEECVLGIVGRPVLLPCFHEALSFHNVSVEWRRGSDLVVKAEWEDDGHVLMWSLNSATIPSNALVTGDFSLELPKVNPKEDKMLYSLFLSSPGNGSALLCSVCLRTAASFSAPLLQKVDSARGNETVFICQSSGGFPEPTVYWLINDTEQPPEGSVRTTAGALPDSDLYNVTSLLTLTAHDDDDGGVSCSVENQRLNETLTSRSTDEAKDEAVGVRAFEGIWMFSTGLCVAIGIMVGAGVAYQIHLDRLSKKRKVQYESTRAQRGYKRRNQECTEETEVTTLTSKETSV